MGASDHSHGAETPLVLLPGLDGTGDLFAPALGLDWRGLRPLACQLPTTGPQDYESLADRLAPALPAGEMILLAESFSTPLAMLLARRHPDRVRALVLVAGFCSAPHSPGFGWLPLRPLFALTPPPLFLRRYLCGADASGELTASLAAAIGRTPGKTMAERVRVVLALRAQDCPDLDHLPLLLLQAQHDRVVPWAAQSALEHHFPAATTVWLDGPHLLMQTRARQCRDAVVEFLAAEARSAEHR
jgi:pimeloyl-ACP methyl ester carboxylesterase